MFSLGYQALLASSVSSLKASFETWHNRLGHIAFDVISALNKNGCLVVTSILLNRVICSS